MIRETFINILLTIQRERNRNSEAYPSRQQRQAGVTEQWFSQKTAVHVTVLHYPTK